MTKTTKNQHFVPQCLLRNFTSEGDVVNIYDSSRKKLRNPTSVARVLSENYFYDKDNIVENFLAVHIEGPASRVFKLIRGESDKSLDIEDQISILRFIMVQLSRTPSALSTSLNNLYTLMDDVIQQLGELNGFSKGITNDIKFSLNDPKDLLRMQTVDSVLDAPILLDLKWNFIINNTDIDFFISDNPVIHYNWYLREDDSIDSTGLTKRGVQIFLPLSNRITLCLYDDQVYKVGEKGKHYTLVNSNEDIHLLNELQFRNRKSYVVFTQTEDSDYVKRCCNQIPSDSLYIPQVEASEVNICGDEARSTIIQWRKPYRFNHWLTFSKIKKKISKREVCNVDRCPEMLALHNQKVQELKNSAKAL
ncbi:DUF4238 domain-containing protein [Vibrio sp. 780]|uniref:DUF4238 domain-containing protein n=1 Tax=unclassified Vibrio TaxID=2614977 RepID=UPI002964D7EA|nr:MULTISPECIES: DUF4238 domain-containing protein [unclassified Vibrio]MDW1950519.1 DUF4238 domain-containing protein [Vibrio sp. 812(2023)]MDW1991625.1 DUF4238 domain-containing protein [Vibrio sp. 780]